MSVLGKIFSSGATELVKGVGGVLDNLITSKEEKLEAERKVKELVSSYEIEMEKNITERWKMDMQSDSWLSKNIRPLVLVFLVVSTVLMIFIDAGTINFITISINNRDRCLFRRTLTRKSKKIKIWQI